MTEHGGAFIKSDTASTPADVVSISTTSATVIAANTNRIGVYITNTHASQTLSLSLGGTAVAGKGIVLQAGQAAYINDYTGAINGIGSGASTTVALAEVGA